MTSLLASGLFIYLSIYLLKTKKIAQKNSKVTKMSDEERRSGKENPKKEMDNPSFL